MAEFLINGFLIFLLAIIAVVAIRSIKIFSTVMLAGAYSLICAIIFVSLDAVDVAFTEAAVGAGLSTVLYIAAMRHLPKREKVVNDNTIFALIVCFGVGCLLIWASFDLPVIGDPMAPIHQHVGPYYISNTKPDMGIPNLVTGVLASYRGYDTLGETVVIFTAGLGVLLLLGDGKNRDKTIFPRPYPNIKGSLSGGYDNDRAPDAMRSFLNADLAKKDNELFKALITELEKKSEIFADALINLVLKTNLYSELDAKNLGNYTFGFALVTGIGEIKQGKPFAYEGKAYDLYTVLDGLSQLKGNKEKYQIKVNMDLKEATNAAKTYFTLSKKQTPILNLELRYKGDKTPQPQFLGTISQEFIDILMKSPLIKKNG